MRAPVSFPATRGHRVHHPAESEGGDIGRVQFRTGQHEERGVERRIDTPQHVHETIAVARRVGHGGAERERREQWGEAQATRRPDRHEDDADDEDHGLAGLLRARSPDIDDKAEQDAECDGAGRGPQQSVDAR